MAMQFDELLRVLIARARELADEHGKPYAVVKWDGMTRVVPLSDVDTPEFEESGGVWLAATDLLSCEKE